MNHHYLEKRMSVIYDGTCDDFVVYIEDLLLAYIWVYVAVRMHTARSRNDIDLTLYRMCVRNEVLGCAACVADARDALLGLAEANITTLMPAYTHTQPAQPTTLGHYLAAAAEFLGRDFDRLCSAWTTRSE